MKIAICDDDIKDSNKTKSAIDDVFKSLNFHCSFEIFNDAISLFNADLNQFNAIFLDIDMPKINGLDVAKRLIDLKVKSEIVFITNHDEFVYKAFKYKALGFIRKSFLTEEINEIIDTLIKNTTENQEYITVDVAGVDTRIKLCDIVILQSDDHYVDVIMTDKKIIVRDKLNNLENLLLEKGFIRIHSRYLVNYKYIYSIERTTVILYDKRQLPLSRSKIKQVKEKFQYFTR